MANRTRTKRNEFHLEVKGKQTYYRIRKLSNELCRFLLLMRTKDCEIKGESFGEDTLKFISFRPLPTFYLNILLGININLAYTQYGDNRI